MASEPRSGVRRWAPTASGWPLWDLPGWLVGFILTIIATAGIAIVAAAALTSFNARDAVLFGVLLGCDLATVELTRRSGEPGGGLIKETHAVWELPIALLLPPLYGLLTAVIRLAHTQWRVRRALAYRRVYSASALGLTYAAASVGFRAVAPPMAGFLSVPAATLQTWAMLALACGALRVVLNKILMIIPIKGSDPATSVRAEWLNRRALFDDLAELSIGVLVAVVATASTFLALLALPCVTLLQRSQRHYQLLNEARIDGRTGALNAVPWQREASVRVTRAIRPRAFRGSASARPARRIPQSGLALWLLRVREGRWARPAAEDTDSALVALLMVDIDHFGQINNAWGHLSGNVILEGTAAAIREHLRKTDLLGRYGGDEFAILLPGASAAEAAAIAHRICFAISELTFPLLEDDRGLPEPRITVSVGVAALDGGAHVDLDVLVSAADSAMYQAKADGRNTVRLVSV